MLINRCSMPMFTAVKFGLFFAQYMCIKCIINILCLLICMLMYEGRSINKLQNFQNIKNLKYKFCT